MEEQSFKDCEVEESAQIYSTVTCILKPEVVKAIRNRNEDITAIIEAITGVIFYQGKTIRGAWNEVKQAGLLLDGMVSLSLNDEAPLRKRASSDEHAELTSRQIGACKHQPCTWRSEAVLFSKATTQFIIRHRLEELEYKIAGHKLCIETKTDNDSVAIQCCGKDVKEATVILERFKRYYKRIEETLWIGEFPYCSLLDDPFYRWLLSEMHCILQIDRNDKAIVICGITMKDKVTKVLKIIYALSNDDIAVEPEPPMQCRAASDELTTSPERIRTPIEFQCVSGLNIWFVDNASFPADTTYERGSGESTLERTVAVLPNDVPCGFLVNNSVHVFIHKCDIAILHVDAISYVSSSGNFQNVEGVAKEIYVRAGPALRNELRDVLNSSDPLSISSTVVTSSGNLPCEKVIHSVGPKWTSAYDEKRGKHYLELLRETLTDIILTADNYGFRAIALPAVLSDVAADWQGAMLRIPYEVMTNTYVEILEEVHLVDVDDRAILAVAADFLESTRKEQTGPFHRTVRLEPDIVHSLIKIRTKKRPKDLFIHDSVKVSIYADDITKSKADAIVCPNDEQLSCSEGLAKKIAAIAGDGYKQLCAKAASGSKLEASDIVSVSADRLGIVINAVVPVITVFFGTVEKYSADAYKDFLCQTVHSSIDVARQQGVRYLAMYPLGIGQEHVPNLWIAEVISQALMGGLYRDDQLKEVHIIDTNIDFLTLMWRELNNRINCIQNTVESNPATWSRCVPIAQFREPTISVYSTRLPAARVRPEIVSHDHAVSANKLERPGPNYTTFSSPASVPRRGVAFGFQIGNRLVFVHKCNITMLRVDAIVNFANAVLHHGRGLAKQISDAAGPELQKEGRDIISRSGHVPLTSTVLTSSGRLPCKKVIHAIAPCWSFVDDNEKREHYLKRVLDTLNNILQTANRNSFKSIAMPAVFPGSAELPKREVARVTCEVVTSASCPHLERIHLVCATDDIVSLLTRGLRQMSRNRSPDQRPRVNELSKVEVSSAIATSMRGGINELLVCGRVKVFVYCADIATVEANAIACVNDEKLSCSAGASKRIADCLGADYRRLCANAVSDVKPQQSDVVTISPTNHGLVFNVVLQKTSASLLLTMKYNRSAYEKLLLRSYRNVFNEAKKHGVCVLAMCPLGADDKYVPVAWITDVLCQALTDCLKTGQPLKEIHIVDTNADIQMAVWSKLNKRIAEMGSTRAKETCERKTHREERRSRTPSSTVPAMECQQQTTRSRSLTVSADRAERKKITETPHQRPAPVPVAYDVPCGFLIANDIRVFIHRCDITTLHVDAIVNAANRILRHDSGIAKAIADAAGPELVREGSEVVEKVGPILPSHTVVTTAGALPCKKVIHAVGPDWAPVDEPERRRRCLEVLHDTLINIINTADKYGFKSVAVPAVFSRVIGVSLRDDATVVYEMVASKFGLPKDKVASITYEVLASIGTENLKEVHIVDIKNNVLRLIGGVFHSASLHKQQNALSDVTELSKNAVTSAIRNCMKGHLGALLIHDRIRVFFCTGFPTKTRADVVVCFDDGELSCSAGLAGQLAEMTAGRYRNHCKKLAVGKRPRPPELITMDTENLGVIITAIVPPPTIWSDPSACKDVLYTAMTNALITVGLCGASRLVMSAVETDLKHADRLWVMGLMCQVILDITKRDNQLKEIYIVGINTDFLTHLKTELSKQMAKQEIIQTEITEEIVKQDAVQKQRTISTSRTSSPSSTKTEVALPQEISTRKQTSTFPSTLENVPAQEYKVPCGFLINNTIHVFIHKYDITKLRVDAIVIYTDGSLEHASRIARAVCGVDAALQEREGEDIKNCPEAVPVSETVVTSAGSLPCHKIIQAARPSWPPEDDEKKQLCLKLLRNMFDNIMRTADEHAITSLAIPVVIPVSQVTIGAPVSDLDTIVQQLLTGTDFIPKQDSARILCEVMTGTSTSNPKEVHLVHTSDDALPLTGAYFGVMANRRLANEFHDVIELSQDVVLATIRKRTKEKKTQPVIYNRVMIFISCDDITKMKADAIVCPNNKKLSCSKGLAKRIAELAGKQYRRQCKQAASKRKLHSCDVVCIETKNLGLIINVVVPRLSTIPTKGGIKIYKYLLRVSCQNAFDEAARRGVSCLAISPLGAGHKNVPSLWVAEALCQVIKDVIKSDQQLKEIHVVHPDNSLVTLLVSILNKFIISGSDADVDLEPELVEVEKVILPPPSKLPPPAVRPTETIAAAKTTPAVGKITIITCKIPCGFLIGDSLSVFIHNCDITMMQTDAVVNLATKNLDHPTGVTKAIFDAGGSQLEREGKAIIERLGSIPVSETVVTSAGELPCKKVIHAVGPSWPFGDRGEEKRHCLKLLHDTFINILRTSDRHVIASLAIPAVTSGIISDVPKHDVAAITGELIKSVFNVPKEDISRILCEVLLSTEFRCLKEIHLVAVSDGILATTGRYLLQLSKISQPTGFKEVVELGESVVLSAIQRRVIAKPEEPRIVIRVKVFISCGDITKAGTDAIACPNDKKLSCSTGLAKRIASLAEVEYKNKCRQIGVIRNPHASDVVSINTKNLGLIINVIVPQLSEASKKTKKYNVSIYKKLLRVSFRNAIKEAIKCGVCSLALSPLVLGEKHIPNMLIAEALCKAIPDAIKSNEHLKELHIIDTNKEFISLLRSKLRKDVTSVAGVEVCGDQAEMEKADVSAPFQETHPQIAQPEITTTTSPHPTTPPREVGRHVSGPGVVSKLKLEIPYGFLISKSLRIFIHECDITNLDVDVIVNFTNEKLDHTMGLAKVIYGVAGPELEKASNDYVNGSGPIPVSTVVTTSAGQLPCKKVIHAVGPAWPFTEGYSKRRHCLTLLRKTYFNIIRAAEEWGFKSLAMPAIVIPGIVWVPTNEVTRTVCEILLNALEVPKYEVARNICDAFINADINNLKEVHLVDNTDEILSIIVDYLLQMSRKKLYYQLHPVIQLGDDVASSTVRTRLKRRPQEFLTYNGVKLFIYHEDLTNVKTDAIVCPNDDELSCSTGLANNVANVLGDAYQKKCNELVNQKKLRPSDVASITTESRGVIINAVVPQYEQFGADDPSDDSFKRLLRATLQNALDEAKRLPVSSLALPPLGADQKNVPKHWIASIMGDALNDNIGVDQQLNEVHIVDTDDELLKLLKDKLQMHIQPDYDVESVISEPVTKTRLAKEPTPELSNEARVCKTMPSPAKPPSVARTDADYTTHEPVPAPKCRMPSGFLTMSFIRVFIHECDITKLQVDAIVSPTNGNLDHASGIAKAIFDAGGAEMEEARRRMLRNMGPIPSCQTVITSAGSLSCRLVIHAVGPKWPYEDDDKKIKQCLKHLQNMITNILHAADRHGIESLAIPAVTSGALRTSSNDEALTVVCEVLAKLFKIPPHPVADLMCEAITSTKTRNLKEVHLVDNTDHLLSLLICAFLERNKRRPGKELLDVVRLDRRLVVDTIRRRLKRNQRELLLYNRVKVFLYSADVTMSKIEAVVLPNDEKLSCSSGLAKDLADSAGDSYKEQCREAAKKRKLAPSDVVSIKTDNRGLVINVVVPQRKRGPVKLAYKDMLRESFRNAVDEAIICGASILALSRLVADEEDVPKTLIADAMCQALVDSLKFDEHINEVHIVDMNDEFLTIVWKNLKRLVDSTTDVSVRALPKRTKSVTSVAPPPPESRPEATVEDVLNPSTSTKPAPRIQRGYLTMGLIQVFIHKCDITKLHVDAIVCPTNGNLSHSAGVAKAIHDAAGPEMDREASKLISTSGPVKVSETAVTSSGRMTCGMVIHAVGPVWPSVEAEDKRRHCLRLLHDTVINIFSTADQRGVHSIAMPSVIAGNAGIPEHHVSTAIKDTLAETVPEGEIARITCHALTNVSTRTVREVHIVNIDDGVLSPMAAAFDRMSRSKDENGLLRLVRLDVDGVKSTIDRRRRAPFARFVYFNGVELRVSTDELRWLSADAVVCRNDVALSCSFGAVGSLAKTRAVDFERLCRTATRWRRPRASDAVAVATDKRSLIIINAVVPRLNTSYWTWTTADDDVYRLTLARAYVNAIDEAARRRVSRLAIYPLGSEEYFVPHIWVIDQLCEAIIRRLANERQIKEVHIVHKDHVLARLIWEELRRRVYLFTTCDSTASDIVLED